MNLKKINTNTRLSTNKVSFGVITPEHLFININGYGKDLSWAEKMTDIIDISSKKIISDEIDFNKLLNHVSDKYKSYFDKFDKKAKFGVYRHRGIGTPINGEKYEGYLKRVRELVLGDSKKTVRIDWAKQFFNFTKEPLELEDEPVIKVLADINIISIPLNNRIVPLTETHRVFGFPLDMQLEKDKQEVYIWNHTSPEYIKEVLNHIKKIYSEIIKDKNLSLEETIAKIGELHWLFCQTAPFYRGNAGIADIIVKSIFEAKKIQVSPWGENIAPDLEAFVTPLEQYKKIYSKLYQTPPQYM